MVRVQLENSEKIMFANSIISRRTVVVLNGISSIYEDTAVGIRLRWFSRFLKAYGFEVKELVPFKKYHSRNVSQVSVQSICALFSCPIWSVALFLLIGIMYTPLAFLSLLIIRPDVILISMPLPSYGISFGLAHVIYKRFSRKKIFLIYDYRDPVLEKEAYRYAYDYNSILGLISLEFLTAVLEKLMRSADLILTTTNYLKKQLNLRGIVNVITIYNGSDLIIPSKNIKNKKDTSFKLVLLSKYIIGAGHYNRVDVAVKSLIECYKICKNINVDLILIGSVSKRFKTWYEKIRITHPEIDGHIKFLGEMPHDYLMDVLINCDVGLILYDESSVRANTIPVKFFEYISAGLPVIVSVVSPSELGDIVKNYGLGFICDPLDYKCIARTICFMFQNRIIYEEMQKNALKASRMFQRTYWAKIFARIVKKLVDG
ncbi:MAG: glycosyltransferase [Nitrososphaeria archaeon]